VVVQLSATHNADASATKRPELTVDGITYHGRILSIVEWMAFKDRFAAYEQEARTLEAIEAVRLLMLDYLRATFPPIVTRRGLFRRRVTIDPIAGLASLGLRDISEAFSLFFGHQLYAMGMSPGSRTDGTSLPDRIAKAPSENGSVSSTS